MKLFKFLFALPLMLMIYILPASAQYSYELVSPPSPPDALARNNAGLFDIYKGGNKVVGRAWDNKLFGVGSYSFEYDMKKVLYTEIGGGFTAIGINNQGVMVGDVDGVCAIRDKDGNRSFLYPDSWTEYSSCQARGVNADGKVSGYVIDEYDVWSGFIYDSEYGTYEEFLPSEMTLAHGINEQGQNVGSVILPIDGVSPPQGFTPKGRYGYLREPDGSVRYFEISQTQSFPGSTSIRGISNNGLICGFYLDPDTQERTGFATTIPEGNEFETISLTDDEVLHPSPCDPDLLPPEEEDIVLRTAVFTHQVRNNGVVVGRCTDYLFDLIANEVKHVYPTYGLIATPIRKGKDGF